MQALNFKKVVSVIIRLVERRDSWKEWTGDVGQRMKESSVNDNSDEPANGKQTSNRQRGWVGQVCNGVGRHW
jgi:hypothetical protein